MAIPFGTLVGPLEILSRLQQTERATFAALRLIRPRNSGSLKEEASRLLSHSLIALAAMLMASSASAHHSHAMFDTDKQLTLVGIVKEFEWNNPHCWIQLLVADPNDANAAPVEWGVEMGAPIQLIRHGWKPSSVKPGDKITVVVNPWRDGRPAGQIVSAIGADGKPIAAVPETNGK